MNPYRDTPTLLPQSTFRRWMRWFCPFVKHKLIDTSNTLTIGTCCVRCGKTKITMRDLRTTRERVLDELLAELEGYNPPYPTIPDDPVYLLE